MTQALAPIHPTVAVLPAAQEWSTILQMSDILVKSGFLPTSIKTAPQAAMIILKGRELSIPPIQALSHIHVIQGKPACSAELILALLGRAGVTWEWLEDGTNGKAAVQFNRPGFKPVVGRFSAEEAKTAGLTNPNWKSYPAAMLRARAITNGARMIGPDLIMGLSYTPEELGASVNDQGEVVESPQPRQDAPGRAIPSPPEEEPEQAAPPASEPAEDDDDLAVQERRAAIQRIIELEARFTFNSPQHRANKRKKYAGADELDQASLDGLCAYLEALEKAVQELGK